MKILVVADIKSPYYFDCYTPGKLKDFDDLSEDPGPAVRPVVGVSTDTLRTSRS